MWWHLTVKEFSTSETKLIFKRINTKQYYFCQVMCPCTGMLVLPEHPWGSVIVKEVFRCLQCQFNLEKKQ